MPIPSKRLVFSVNLYSYEIDPEERYTGPNGPPPSVLPPDARGEDRSGHGRSDEYYSQMTWLCIPGPGEPVIALPSAVEHAIDRYFGLKESMEQAVEVNESRDKEEELSRLRTLVEDAPIVKVVNSLIQQAVIEKASDIHIEPSGKGVRIRMRVDGILHDLMSPPKGTQPVIVSRIKIMSGSILPNAGCPRTGAFYYNRI